MNPSYYLELDRAITEQIRNEMINNEYEVLCSDCHGIGSLADNELCPNCEGNGYYLVAF